MRPNRTVVAESLALVAVEHEVVATQWALHFEVQLVVADTEPVAALVFHDLQVFAVGLAAKRLEPDLLNRQLAALQLF